MGEVGTEPKEKQREFERRDVRDTEKVDRQPLVCDCGKVC